MLSPEAIEKIIMVFVTALATGVPTYLLARPKQKNDQISLKAETDKTYQALLFEMQEKLPIWIKRYEDEYEEKMEIQGLLRFAETEMHRLSKELRLCEDNKSQCRQVIEEAKSVFVKFETALSEATETAQLLIELKEFKMRLEKI
jgi:hypothetical protein